MFPAAHTKPGRFGCALARRNKQKDAKGGKNTLVGIFALFAISYSDPRVEQLVPGTHPGVEA